MERVKTKRWGGLWVAGVVVCLGVAGGPRGAAADDKKAVGRSLFESAMKVLKDGKPTEETCAQLEESNKLDPGIGTHFYWAECLEKVGKLGSAYAHYQDVVEQATAAGMPDHAKYAQARVDALRPRISKVIVVLGEDMKATPGLVVKRDGLALGAATLGTALPVDPGKHVFAVSAPGKRTWETTVNVADQAEGATFTVTIPTLQEEPNLAPAASGSATAGPAGGAGGAGSAPGGWGGRHTAGVVIAGLGVVGLGVGAGMGAVAMGKHDESKAACPGRTGCSAGAIDLENQAKGAATVSTIGLVAGGVALAGGAVLFLTAGWPFGGGAAGEKAGGAGVKSVSVRANVGPGSAAVSFEGAF